MLRRYILRLDFDRQQIEVFTDGEYLPEPEAEVLEFELSRKIPVIYAELSLNERETVEGRFMLDTGAGAALILNSPFVQRLQLIQRTQPRYLQRSFGLSNQYMESYMGRMAGIGLGSYYFSALPTKLSMAFQGVESLEEIDGIIGNELLKKFNLTFDYRDQLIFIHPSRYFDEPLRVDCSGLKLQYDSTFTAIEVLDVIAASPAGEAGLRPGDVLRELNGQPVQQLALEAILDYLRREGEEVEVRIERQGKILTKRFTLKALI
ncbi:MAG: PDZ domain-containing protein [Bacteroidetes bacterium]|nr:MAG: PDZ domain-containing protein [Bacteroidota bacterium]